MLSAGRAIAAFEDENSGFDGLTPNPGAIPQPYARQDSGSESGFTLAGEPPADDFEASPGGFPPPHEFDQSDVIAVPAELLSPPPQQPTPAKIAAATTPTAKYPDPRSSAPRRRSAPDDYNLETALEALDVDLDDISIPHASTELHREGSPSQRIPGRPDNPSAPASAVRASTRSCRRAAPPTSRAREVLSCRRRARLARAASCRRPSHQIRLEPRRAAAVAPDWLEPRRRSGAGERRRANARDHRRRIVIDFDDDDEEDV